MSRHISSVLGNNIHKCAHITQWAKWAKSPKKQSAGVYFDNMALYFVCQINKKRTLLDRFLAIFPTGHYNTNTHCINHRVYHN